ncbi:MAG TPA: periplasmic heavy metal sensor [Bacteroidales bacterium]|nr:periplasmic heavy metal sensor [Bacteroidales bacterium]HPB26202.1 periplasmic heavy metal sensor [Bacteroidales bacterium]HPI30563.1 periplasmic heavy metal sensor [Bacteroidales bacterium]HQN15506.1 periplasmic heavy metal sensor [Bacteroidales bacterium]HQP14797.1 periplasmic heavy metal sensor [Bacteroidales bacterium]
MKTRKVNYLLAIVVAIAMVFASTNTYSQCNKQQTASKAQQVANQDEQAGCMNRQGMMNLTPEQEKQMDAIHQKHMKEVLPLKNLIAEKKAHLVTISSGDNVDLVAVNKTIDEMYALKADIAKKQAAMKQEVRKILNDDQKLIFDMNHAKKKGMGCDSGKKMGYGMGQHQGAGCGMNKGMQGQGCGMGQQSSAGCGMHQGKGMCCPQQGQGFGCQQQGQGCCKDKAGSPKSGCQHGKK